MDKKTETVKFYDAYWRRQSDAHREQVWKSWWAEGYAHLDELVGPCEGKRVLLIGVGPGGEAEAYARRGAWVAAVDAAPSSVEMCAARARAGGLGGRLTPVAADAEALPFRGGVFDAALVLNMIMHADAGRVVAECQRLLRPGGVWGLIEPMRYPHLAVAARWLEPHRRRTCVRYVRLSDILRWGRGAASLRHREFFFLSTCVVMARRVLPTWGFLKRMMDAACRADRALLRRCALLRPLAYLVVAVYRPKEGSR